jgi:hypothetical protein
MTRPDSQYDGDGKTYKTDLGWFSPEGNLYGQIRFVREFIHRKWWDGRDWIDVEIAGRAASVQELPVDPRPFGQIWQARVYIKETNSYVWQEYFRDYEAPIWKPLKWKWTVPHFSELPSPGFEIGEAHLVIEPSVPHFWESFQWQRFRHSSLEDDESERHLPPGFLQMLTPDARVVFVSNTEIGIEAVKGGSGRVWVNGEYIEASRSASVLNSLAVLNWDTVNQRLVPAVLQNDSEYWIYLANTQDRSFVIEAFEICPAWDYRGKLLLSQTADTAGHLSGQGAGRNARLVGKISTDNRPASEGGPYFLRELDISLISRTTSFPETYRDYSDYQIRFIDENALRFALMDGAYGQIYVAGDLYYLGIEYLINRSDPTVEWKPELPGKVRHNAGNLQINSVYYIYISAEIDAFNFNEINPDTNRPWESTDANSAAHYNADLDIRLKPFLSLKEPEHSRMSAEYPGYYVRWIGVIRTDAYGYFINARNISQIRQPVLDPTFFDGLAEISMATWGVDQTAFRIFRKIGTSGIIQINGRAIPLDYIEDSVYDVKTSDVLYAYNEQGTPHLSVWLPNGNPITIADTGAFGWTLYVYLCNDIPAWGDLRNKLIVTGIHHDDGYLSRNFPGNNARWVCTIKADLYGKFSGSFILQALESEPLRIDDAHATVTETWSSQKIQGELNKIWNTVNSEVTWRNEKANGLNLFIEWTGATTVRLRTLDPAGSVIVFQSLDENSNLWYTQREISYEGETLDLGNNAGNTLYFLYITDNGFQLRTSAPGNTTNAIYYNDATEASTSCEIFVGVVGFASDGTMKGYHNVCSFWNEPTRQFAIDIDTSNLPHMNYAPKYPVDNNYKWSSWPSNFDYIHSYYYPNQPYYGRTTFSLEGYVQLPRLQTTISRTGQTYAIGMIYVNGWGTYFYDPIVLGSFSTYQPWGGAMTQYTTVDIYLSESSVQGYAFRNSFWIEHKFDSHHLNPDPQYKFACPYQATQGGSSITGQIVVTRKPA